MILPQNVSDPEPVEDKKSGSKKTKSTRTAACCINIFVGSAVSCLELVLIIVLGIETFGVKTVFLNSSASYSFSDMFGDAVVASDEQTQENAS